ncbi:hypothetical protein N2152v2_002952 [Parachlorella kessleri]
MQQVISARQEEKRPSWGSGSAGHQGELKTDEESFSQFLSSLLPLDTALLPESLARGFGLSTDSATTTFQQHNGGAAWLGPSATGPSLREDYLQPATNSDPLRAGQDASLGGLDSRGRDSGGQQQADAAGLQQSPSAQQQQPLLGSGGAGGNSGIFGSSGVLGANNGYGGGSLGLLDQQAQMEQREGQQQPTASQQAYLPYGLSPGSLPFGQPSGLAVAQLQHQMQLQAAQQQASMFGLREAEMQQQEQQQQDREQERQQQQQQQHAQFQAAAHQAAAEQQFQLQQQQQVQQQHQIQQQQQQQMQQQQQQAAVAQAAYAYNQQQQAMAMATAAAAQQSGNPYAAAAAYGQLQQLQQQQQMQQQQQQMQQQQMSYPGWGPYSQFGPYYQQNYPGYPGMFPGQQQMPGPMQPPSVAPMLGQQQPQQQQQPLQQPPGGAGAGGLGPDGGGAGGPGVTAGEVPHLSNGGGYLHLAGADEGADAQALKRPRLIWTDALHKRFVEALGKCGGVDKALPKAIMKEMDVKGLTRENVASHLQKHRMRLRKAEDVERKDHAVAAAAAQEGQDEAHGSSDLLEGQGSAGRVVGREEHFQGGGAGAAPHLSHYHKEPHRQPREGTGAAVGRGPHPQDRHAGTLSMLSDGHSAEDEGEGHLGVPGVGDDDFMAGGSGRRQEVTSRPPGRHEGATLGSRSPAEPAGVRHAGGGAG